MQVVFSKLSGIAISNRTKGAMHTECDDCVYRKLLENVFALQDGKFYCDVPCLVTRLLYFVICKGLKNVNWVFFDR